MWVNSATLFLLSFLQAVMCSTSNRKITKRKEMLGYKRLAVARAIRSAPSMLQCQQYCAFSGPCKATNYHTESHQDNCELIDSESNDDVAWPNFLPSQSSIYVEYSRDDQQLYKDIHVFVHFYGLCLAYDDANSRVAVTSDCKDKFMLKYGKVIHLRTGKILKPDSNNDQSIVRLTNDFADPNTDFVYREDSSTFLHVATNKCMCPYWVLIEQPPSGRQNVIYHTCVHEGFKFSIQM